MTTRRNRTQLSVYFLFFHMLALTLIISRERREHRIFMVLLARNKDLQKRLMTGSEEEILEIGLLVCVIFPQLYFSLTHRQIRKGVSGARSDDTKSLKRDIVDWITPDGQRLNPPLYRHIKSDRGFRHDRTGELLCPIDLDWNDPE